MSLDNIEFHISKPVELTPDIILAAQKSVCHHSKDAEEAAEFMRIIGIHPGNYCPLRGQSDG